MKSSFLVGSASALLLVLAACTSSEGNASSAEPEAVAGGYDCDISAVLCRITQPQCPDGQTATRSGDCYGRCAPIAQCKPHSFACHQGGPATCRIVMPTCRAGETLTEVDGCFGPCVPSSVCSDPQPDNGGSGQGTANCNIATIECRITPPHCPAGQKPTVDADGFCYGPCVDASECR